MSNNLENEVLKIADEMMQAITQADQWNELDRNSGKEAKEYLDELCTAFKKTLSSNQEKMFALIGDVRTNVEAQSNEAAILYGMQVYEAFKAMIGNPANFLEFYLGKSIPIREFCKLETED